MVYFNIRNIVYATYFRIYVLITYLFLNGSKFINKLLHLCAFEMSKGSNTNNKIEIMDVNKKYIEVNKKKFLQLIENPTLILNKNINSGFYSKKEFQQLIQEENNILEPEWKTRILFENTPRGNVIMYYNTYKLGFSYYSDQYIPYDILNSIAMKYVITYRCLDFFMDELVLPENKKSSLMLLIKDDKKELETNKNSNIDEEFKNKLKNAPFAKLKSYRKQNDKKDDTKKDDAKKDDTKKDDTIKEEKIRNRFINMGKTCNYNFLKVPVKQKISLFSPSELANNLLENSSVQKEVFSYRNFKNSKKEIIQESNMYKEISAT
jgi:hypothetical protein